MRHIEQFLAERSDVVKEMGAHPESQAVFEQLVSYWRQGSDKDDFTARKEIALAFPDHKLGLFALNACLSGQDRQMALTEFCKSIVNNQADSRIGCMALDYLLKSTPDQTVPMCEHISTTHPNTRVAHFAIMRKGDWLADHSDSTGAMRAWMAVWVADPEMGAKRYNKLCAVWMREGEWLAPTLIGGQFIEEADLNPIKESALIRCSEPAPPASVQAATAAIAKPLAAANLVELCDVLDATFENWTNSGAGTDPEKAELALGIFLLGGSGDNAFCLPSKLNLTQENRFQRCRRKALGIVQESKLPFPVNLGAFYHLRIANRMMEDLQARNAATALNLSWEIPGLAQTWRERLLGRYSEILEGDNLNVKAAKAYAAYCDRFDDAPPAFWIKSGILYMLSGDTSKSQERFNLFEQRAANDEEKALACFLIAVNLVEQKEYEMAKERFTRIAEQYFSSKYAPQALAQLGAISMTEKDYEKARKYLEHIKLKYPDWEQTRRYEEMLELLGRL